MVPGRRPLVRAGVAALLVVVLGACGDDGGGNGEAAPPAPDGTTTTTAPSTSAPSTTVALSPVPRANPEQDRFCRLVGNQLAGARELGGRLAGSPSGAAEAVAEQRQQHGELIDAAPSEIRPDVEVVLAAGGRYFDLLEDAGYELDNVPSGSLDDLQTSEVRSAANREAAYLEKVCGLDLDGGRG
jgi:hypothetical protein